jgi:hypothetical protein
MRCRDITSGFLQSKKPSENSEGLAKVIFCRDQLHIYSETSLYTLPVVPEGPRLVEVVT